MRGAAVVLASVLLGVVFAGAQEDDPKPRKDSVRLVVTGCLNKRVLNATRIETEDITVDVHDFSLSGKKDVMAEVKGRNKQPVTVTGWVRKVDLTEPGFKVGGSHIRIGPATSSDPMRPELPDQTRRIITMEALKVAPAEGNCRGK